MIVGCSYLFNFDLIKLNKMSTPEFNELIINNTTFLKPFAFTLTRDNESAKDLVQETLFRALANRDKYNRHQH